MTNNTYEIEELERHHDVPQQVHLSPLLKCFKCDNTWFKPYSSANFRSRMSDPFPEIKSKHSLVAKYVTEPLWEKLSRAVTATSEFTLAKAIACAVQFDNQHCGIYAGDWDSYKVRYYFKFSSCHIHMK